MAFLLGAPALPAPTGSVGEKYSFTSHDRLFGVVLRVESKPHNFACSKWHAQFIMENLEVCYIEFAICWFGATNQKFSRLIPEMREP